MDAETVKLVIQGGAVAGLGMTILLIFRIAIPQMMDMFSTQLKSQRDVFANQLSQQRTDFLLHLAQSRQDFVASEVLRRADVLKAIDNNTRSTEKLTHTIELRPVI